MSKADTSHKHVMSGGLSAPGWLAGHLRVAAILFVLGVLIFAVLAYELKTHGPLLRWDVPLASMFYAESQRAPASFNEIMTFGFFFGKELIELIGVILVVYFLHKRFWPELGMVILGWSGAALLWFILTRIFDRVRPEAQTGIVVHEPSFPSGHTMQAVLCFGMLAYFVIPHMPSRAWKWVIGIASILAMLFVGFSRLYQSGHYLTDLIAGYALGIAWASLVYTALEAIALRRRG